MATRHEAAYQRDLKDYREAPFISGIRIRTTENSCALCHFVAGCYRMADAPPRLPDDCESCRGCTVWWVPLFNDEATPQPWRTEETYVEKDEIRRGIAIENCVFQIDNHLKLLANPKTKPKTREFRLQLLKDELAKLEALDPLHPQIAEAKGEIDRAIK